MCFGLWETKRFKLQNPALKKMRDWSMEEPMDGIAGELSTQHGGLRSTLLFFMAVAWYNVIELVVLVLTTFRRWRGLYFWSLLLSGVLGVAPYTVGFLLKFFTQTPALATVTVLTVGWWTMVTGQSLVLYSRLHLVLRDERLLHRVLRMILANVLLLHVPTTVLTYGANLRQTPAWLRGYNIIEKLQLTGFTVQEVVISLLYIWETVKLLRMCAARENRKIMRQLVGINVAMLVMDLVLLSLEYADYYAVQISLKGAVYSIKLKLEFAVLGRLVAVVHNRCPPAPIDGDLQLNRYAGGQQGEDDDGGGHGGSGGAMVAAAAAATAARSVAVQRAPLCVTGERTHRHLALNEVNVSMKWKGRTDLEKGDCDSEVHRACWR